MRRAFDDLLTRIGKDRRVVVFADVPKWDVNLPEPVDCVLSRLALPRRPCDSDPSYITNAFFNHFEKPSHDVLRSVAEANHAIAYSPEDYLCSSQGCRTFVNGVFIYRD